MNNLRRVALQIAVAGFVGLSLTACADINFPDLNTVFEDNRPGQVKRDANGNAIIPKS